MSHYYRERHEQASQPKPTNPKSHEPTDEQKTEPLPRTHADLDNLADERGQTWSADNLTVKQKQDELDVPYFEQ